MDKKSFTLCIWFTRFMQDKKQIKVAYYKFPLGELMLGSIDESLCMCDWRYRNMRNTIDTRIKKGLNAEFESGSSTVIRKAALQLEEYFTGLRTSFDVPIYPVGTQFQLTVWEKLMDIPYGETISYLELSNRMGDEKAIRAVASANGANALSIFIPCHRVIAKNGKLTGYAGGLDAKRRLLLLESMGIHKHELPLFS